MADLTVQSMTIDGVSPTYGAAAAGGDTFDNDGSTFLHVKNGGGSGVTVTLQSQVSSPPPGTVAADKQITVAASGEQMIGPVNKAAFNDASGKVNVTYSGVTSVTVAAIKLVS